MRRCLPVLLLPLASCAGSVDGSAVGADASRAGTGPAVDASSPDASSPDASSPDASSPDGAPSPDGSSSGGETSPDGDTSSDNVLIVIADDMGMESFVCDERFADLERADQPTLRTLCDRGVTFTQAWSYPVCSPTRAAITTGRHGWWTGIGEAVGHDSEALDPDELTLPQALDLAGSGYDHALVGKWHLSLETGDPNAYGWGHFAGSVGSEPEDYEAWTREVDGVAAIEYGYATSVNVDDALAWLEGREDPWLLWVAFNAPHKPLHLPPADLHGFDELSGEADEIAAHPEQYHMAMIEALDTELGRLLDGIPPETLARTWIVFLSDNGSTANVTQGVWPNDQAKGTLGQGGVNVPFVIAGPGIPEPGRVVETPVHVVDLYATLLDMAGVDPLVGRSHLGDIDSQSLLPLVQDREATLARDVLMTGMFGPRTSSTREGLAARDGHYRLLVYESGELQLHDLQSDPLGAQDLLAAGTLSLTAQAHYERLAEHVDAARDESRHIEW